MHNNNLSNFEPIQTIDLSTLFNLSSINNEKILYYID